jgi:hypothetical protein
MLVIKKKGEIEKLNYIKFLKILIFIFMYLFLGLSYKQANLFS